MPNPPTLLLVQKDVPTELNGTPKHLIVQKSLASIAAFSEMNCLFRDAN